MIVCGLKLFLWLNGRLAVGLHHWRWLLIGAMVLGCLGSGCRDDESSDASLNESAEAVPSKVTIHRLNRAEYNNTVRDLLGTEMRPADDFPLDDFGYGFDNIADVLTVSPLLVELYAYAAEKMVAELLDNPITEPQLWHIEAETAETTVGGQATDGWNLWSNGELYSVVNVPMDGRYQISARVYATRAGDELARSSLMVDGAIVETFSIAASSAQEMEVIEAEVDITAGLRQISVTFDNDFYEPEEGLDRNLIVDWIRLTGPIDVELPGNPRRDVFLSCDNAEAASEACSRVILKRFAEAAYRRPLREGELDGLVGFVTLVEGMGDSWDVGIGIALEKILTSPHFIYRMEYGADISGTGPQPLTAFELASRLSYFLWSSMPDQELFEKAQDGSLLNHDVLRAQASRMLSDPKAEALVQNFAGQWLHINAIDDAFPDVWYFPDFDEQLRESMKGEMQHFVRSLLFQDRSLLDLLNSENGWVDARLASHYGIDDFSGDGFQEVWLSPYQRGGMLTQAGWLMSRSYPTRTSPVKRGKWILEHLLCTPPAPPPPGVEGLEEAESEGGTIREKLERHRTDPVCAACHQAMDPLGFGLEHFDGIGAFRDFDGESPVNAADALPDGRSFDGALELQAILSADERVPACMTEKLFVYGIGRGVKTTDWPYLESIEKVFAASDYRFESLVHALVTSDAFTMVSRGQDD